MASKSSGKPKSGRKRGLQVVKPPGPAPEPVSPESTSPSQHRTIVGFGASAGGLEAFSEVLAHMPSNSGLALVLVQHLDPKHSSVLAELLSRATLMPVLEIRDGM